MLEHYDQDQRIMVTYDVGCQYKQNWETRVTEGGLLTKDQLPTDLEFKVPAFHMGGHQPQCQDDHHLRHTPLAGRLCGEIVEPVWNVLNPYQYATREMGFGHRIENLSDVMNDLNFAKGVVECGCSSLSSATLAYS